jgi:hypothetical protein
MRLAACILLSAAAATAGQINVPAGSGFANACAGSQIFGSLPNPGDGFSAPSDQYVTCNTSIAGAAAASSSFAGSNGFGSSWTNAATAIGQPGLIKVGASDTDTGGAFPGASAYAGWNDQITISGGTGQAVWLVGLHVDGQLSAAGAGALARLGISAYDNHNFLQPYGNSINSFAYSTWLAANGGSAGVRNDAIYFSWDYQGLWWGAVNYGPGDPSNVASYSVNRMVYFALPFTYGTPFTAGFYRGGVGGGGGSGGVTPAKSAAFDFTHTVTWGGAGQVIDQGNHVNPNFTISSQSGFNYNAPFTTGAPEPGTVGMGAFGAAALWLAAKKKVRS